MGFVGVLAVYVTLAVAYSAWLKRVPVLELAVVAAGFVLRAIGGGVAVDVPFSRWFLIVSCFGSLFLVAGKRAGEQAALGEAGPQIRSTLAAYPADYLRYVWTMASTVAVAGYCLWAFEQAESRTGVPFYELSIIPFLLFVMRYALLVESGRGSSPEELVLGDAGLLGIAAAWIAVFGAGIYIGG